MGAASRNKGRLDKVQYLKKPTFLRRISNHNPTVLNPRPWPDEPIVRLHPVVDAGNQLPTPGARWIGRGAVREIADKLRANHCYRDDAAPEPDKEHPPQETYGEAAREPLHSGLHCIVRKQTSAQNAVATNERGHRECDARCHPAGIAADQITRMVGPKSD